MGEHSRGVVRKTAPPRKTAQGRPVERHGTQSTGRIVALFVGQCYGLIRLANHRDVFFHRSDVREGHSFNDFTPGDIVGFELLEDDVSGPRAVQVARRRSPR